jgi:hypothetical protein
MGMDTNGEKLRANDCPARAYGARSASLKVLIYEISLRYYDTATNHLPPWPHSTPSCQCVNKMRGVTMIPQWRIIRAGHGERRLSASGG